ncbi:MAG: lysophospholipid acyltransferase family protein [Halorhodospira halophila]|uniref:lysophospholipid acyltransferase family protein n=1 Tax=Halorhodospira TaxID=85108 RepID=UPI00191211DE|nr:MULTISPECIES: lysophospholipid acyltransferase family protein [Halorhodospira]MBK5935761.1 lipid A biosynthesis acyltransferase [Halorhodospira halophila]MCC3751558.1 lysophospholipid acyltransferase family protein [Halorhodospira halophila]MCG5540917.1 lysophospholipid acyltransferase family protein [Halorhodospira sp. M39old]MCG5546336.1 lysophospholipid acyltransferase family protein [Halorhodospira sp. M38]
MTEEPAPPRSLEWTLSVLARLPLPVLHAVGAAVGTTLAYLPNRTRQVAEINLRLCFPDLAAGARRRLVRNALQETCKTALEIAPVFKRPPERVVGWVRQVHGRTHFDQALDEGRGVLLLAPHIGCWELLNLWVAARQPLTALYRPPRQPALEPILLAGRSRNGARLLPAGPQGVRGVLRALARREVVGILPDQEPDGSEPFAPFFGVPAKTMTLAGRIAQRSGAVPLFAFAERLPAGRGYDLHFLPADPDVADRDPTAATAAINRGVEQCVRIAPAQYQWTYKRFNTQPDGSRPYPKKRRRRG